jgi:hypothetical protein
VSAAIAQSQPAERPTAACQECGGAFAPSRPDNCFCGKPCRQAFNNRRMQRGSDLYDLFMGLRFERSAATQLKVWVKMCALAASWRAEDYELRAGRPSWGPLAPALGRLAHHFVYATKIRAGR